VFKAVTFPNFPADVEFHNGAAFRGAEKGSAGGPGRLPGRTFRQNRGSFKFRQEKVDFHHTGTPIFCDFF
jgi:hypothetical protein